MTCLRPGAGMIPSQFDELLREIREIPKFQDLKKVDGAIAVGFLGTWVLVGFAAWKIWGKLEAIQAALP